MTGPNYFIPGTAVVLAVVAGIAAYNSPTPNSQYNFNGKLGTKQVKFEAHSNGFGFYDDNQLTVTTEDGRRITYIDKHNDLKLDEVSIGEHKYVKDVIGKPVLEKAQGQYKGYLEQILELKQQAGVNALVGKKDGGSD